jgi:predicted O-methyltransferase YrrM
MSDRIDITSPEITRYLAALRPAPDPLLARLEAEAAAEGWPILHRDAARLLEVLVLAARPERALEIGTAIGYSGTIIARNLPPWGLLETIEIDAETAERAKKNFAEAGLAKKVHVLKGAALEVLRAVETRYDFVFIDAAKEEYESYLAATLPLAPKGALFVVDNLLWGGRVLAAPAAGEEREASTAAIRRFNERFLAHKDLRAAIVPVGDGIGVAVKV